MGMVGLMARTHPKVGIKNPGLVFRLNTNSGIRNCDRPQVIAYGFRSDFIAVCDSVRYIG